MSIKGKYNSHNISADSHVGLLRENNEDSFCFHIDPEGNSFFVAVADGIGGHEDGDVASKQCIYTMLSTWRKNHFSKVRSKRKMQDFLSSVIKKSNEQIFHLNNSNGIQHPMGTTIVSGVFIPKNIILAHAGDSRCYRLRNGKLDKLTQDHSFIEELIEKKIISKEEAKYHPFAHIISKSVGPTASLSPDINIFPREKNDKYLFCSDGLCNHVPDSEIRKIMSEISCPEEAVKKLLYEALRGGGEDNITLVCVFP